MSNPATLQDVADRAGVHRSTVALALRDHPRIPRATRERIKAIAQDVGYRTNPFVAALMQSRRTRNAIRHATLAFVTAYPSRYGWRPEHHDRPDYFPGAVERARDFGYQLEHFWHAEPEMTPARFCDILTNRGVHGLIIGRMPPGKNSLEITWERFSAVALGMTLQSPRLHHVTENHFETASVAMEQCLLRGYRRIGFVFTEANDSPGVGNRWLGAYLRQQLNLAVKDRMPICPGAPTDQAAFSKWFKQHKPDALVVTHSKRILGWLQNLGRRVPDDVGLVELQDHPELEHSGVYYDPSKIGGLAVETLIGLMHRNEIGIPKTPHEVLLSGEWREGQTLIRKRRVQ